MEAMTEDEVMGVIDMLASTRYGITGADFFAAFLEGTAEDKYPHCEDIIELAEVLDR